MIISATACDSTFVNGPAQGAYDSSGAPHILAPRQATQFYVLGAAASSPGDLAFTARASDGAWQHANIPVNHALIASTDITRLAVAGDGRDYLAIHGRGPITFFTRLGGDWTQVLIDPSVPAAALRAESTSVSEVVNTGWAGSDGRVRFVVRDSLLEFEANHLVRAIPIPHDLSRTISRRRNADVAPIGDRTADVTLFEQIGGSEVRAHPASLQCTETECSFTDRTGPDFAAIHGPREITYTALFRLADGTVAHACTYTPFADRQIDVVVSAPGRELLLITNAELVGAAARPAGGFVVVTRPPNEDRSAVLLFAIDAVGNERRVEVGSRDPGHYFSFGMAPGADDTFDVFDSSGNVVTRNRVHAGTGVIDREDIALGD